MARTPEALNDAALEFLTERHLATLATTRPTGTPHVVAVGFTYDRDTRIARVITVDGSQKVRNVERGGYAAVTHVDGPRWLTLEGSAVVSRERLRVAEVIHQIRQPQHALVEVEDLVGERLRELEPAAAGRALTVAEVPLTRQPHVGAGHDAAVEHRLSVAIHAMRESTGSAHATAHNR